MKDSAGRFVAEPLRKGGTFCMMHTILFPREPAPACESIIAYIDLDTNSLDALSGKIVEKLLNHEDSAGLALSYSEL